MDCWSILRVLYHKYFVNLFKISNKGSFVSICLSKFTLCGRLFILCLYCILNFSSYFTRRTWSCVGVALFSSHEFILSTVSLLLCHWFLCESNDLSWSSLRSPIVIMTIWLLRLSSLSDLLFTLCLWHVSDCIFVWLVCRRYYFT